MRKSLQILENKQSQGKRDAGQRKTTNKMIPICRSWNRLYLKKPYTIPLATTEFQNVWWTQ